MSTCVLYRIIIAYVKYKIPFFSPATVNAALLLATHTQKKEKKVKSKKKEKSITWQIQMVGVVVHFQNFKEIIDMHAYISVMMLYSSSNLCQISYFVFPNLQ